jgi:hypothetical protein
MNQGTESDSLGRLAVQMRLLAQEDLREAEAIAAKERAPLGKILIDRGYLKQKDLEMLQVALGTTGVIRRRSP